MSFVQATRLRKGMLIKFDGELFRILELHHLTPGNKRPSTLEQWKIEQ